ncbi:MAG: glutamate racemase [Candidatus Omnitrophica bacterium]|nr:glutamate racemase [Candidatus Omnitrophota bacterium]
MQTTERPIGIFDSGIGGLSVVKEVQRVLPAERLVYFGDTARLPYGTKSKETVVRFSREIVRFLLQFRVKAIVVACHTASSFSLAALQREFDLPIVGVVHPGAEEALRTTRTGRIGILGTRSTIQSGSYQREIKRLNPRTKIFSQSCPLFVPLVEEGHLMDAIAYQVAEKYLRPLKRLHVDTVLLGCTHYPLLKRVIHDVLGEGVRLVDSSHETAEHLKRLLEKDRLVSLNGHPSRRCQFYVSDEPNRFSKVGSVLLRGRIHSVKKVSL